MSVVGHDDELELVHRLHRIEGQVRGLEQMLDEQRYCIDVLTQVAAVRAALDGFAFQVLARHVDTCIADALASGTADTAAAKQRELLAAVRRYARAQ